MVHDVDVAAHCERDNDAEIKITPEMLDAGKKALASYSPYFDLEEDGVRRIYVSMVIARKKDSPGEGGAAV